jgi:hypothetical protein
MADVELLEKLYDKVEKIADTQSEMNVILGKQQVSIDVHIERTKIAEENIALLRKEVEPVKDHVKLVNGFLKILGLAGIVASIITAAVNLFKLLHS